MKEQTQFNIDKATAFKQKAIVWASQFSVFTCLDSHQTKNEYTRYSFIVAVDTLQSTDFQIGNTFLIN